MGELYKLWCANLMLLVLLVCACWGLYSYGMYGQTISFLDRPLLKVEVYPDKILRGGNFPHVFHIIFLQVMNSD
jgi:hypothetical protein